MSKIIVRFSGEARFTPEELWPDGPPDRIDLPTVKQWMEQCGGTKPGLLAEFGLYDNLAIEVEVDDPNQQRLTL